MQTGGKRESGKGQDDAKCHCYIVLHAGRGRTLAHKTLRQAGTALFSLHIFAGAFFQSVDVREHNINMLLATLAALAAHIHSSVRSYALDTFPHTFIHTCSALLSTKPNGRY